MSGFDPVGERLTTLETSVALKANSSSLGALATLNTVANTKLVGGFNKHALVAGAAAGDVTITGIKVGDELNAVLHIIGAGTAVTDVTDLTSQFTISADGKINNTGGTSSSGNKLLVFWTDLTA